MRCSNFSAAYLGRTCPNIKHDGDGAITIEEYNQEFIPIIGNTMTNHDCPVIFLESLLPRKSHAKNLPIAILHEITPINRDYLGKGGTDLTVPLS
jgi:hypothetical protein